MSQLRVCSFGLSLDGFGAGPDQSLELRFVTEGIHAALAQAKAAAGDRDIRVGGGVSTVRQYLQAGLIDELHLAVGPALLGKGEHLLHGLDLRALGYECAETVAGERATHMFVRRR